MEMTTKSLSHASLPKSLISFTHPGLPFLHSKAPVFAFNPVSFPASKRVPTQLEGVKIKARKQKNPGVVHASEAEFPPTAAADRWLLEPAGKWVFLFAQDSRCRNVRVLNDHACGYFSEKFLHFCGGMSNNSIWYFMLEN